MKFLPHTGFAFNPLTTKSISVLILNNVRILRLYCIMQIKVRHDHYVHFINDDRLDSINTKLDLILNTMGKKTDFDALSQRFDASHTAISESLTNLADDVRRLTEGLTPTGGLTEAEATEVFSALEQKANQIEDIASQIRSLADQTPEQPAEPQP
jgi:hypothetical protein